MDVVTVAEPHVGSRLSHKSLLDPSATPEGYSLRRTEDPWTGGEGEGEGVGVYSEGSLSLHLDSGLLLNR